MTEQFSSMERDIFHVPYLSDKTPEDAFHGQAVKTGAYLRVSTALQDVRSQRIAILVEYARKHDFRITASSRRPLGRERTLPGVARCDGTAAKRRCGKRVLRAAIALTPTSSRVAQCGRFPPRCFRGSAPEGGVPRPPVRPAPERDTDLRLPLRYASMRSANSAP